MRQPDKNDEKPKTVKIDTSQRKDLSKLEVLSPQELEVFKQFGDRQAKLLKQTIEFNKPFLEQAQRAVESLAPLIKSITSNINSPIFQQFLQERARVTEQLMELSKSIIIPEIPQLGLLDDKPVIFHRPPANEEVMLRLFDRFEERMLQHRLLPEPKSTKSKQNELCLDRFGKLYRDIKHDWYYKFDEDYGRERLIRFLANYRTFHKADVLVNQSGIKTEKSLRDSISIINKKAGSKLHLEDKLIEGQHGSGYRLNPKYKIIHVDS